jgi:hypothetical protein
MTHVTHHSLCWFCKHFDNDYSEENIGEYRCAAFPAIPVEIATEEFDHRQPHPDDTGIRFEKVESFIEYMQREVFSNYSSIEEIDEAFARTINWFELIKQRRLEVGMDVSSYNDDAPE